MQSSSQFDWRARVSSDQRIQYIRTLFCQDAGAPAIDRLLSNTNLYHNLEPNRLYTCTASIGLVAATKGEHLASRAAAFLRGHFPKIKESSKMHVFNSGILLVSCSCPQQHDGRGEGGGV